MWFVFEVVPFEKAYDGLGPEPCVTVWFQRWELMQHVEIFVFASARRWLDGGPGLLVLAKKSCGRRPRRPHLYKERKGGPATFLPCGATPPGLAEILGLPTWDDVLNPIMDANPAGSCTPGTAGCSQPSVPPPPDPVLQYANCAARVGSQAKRNSAIVEVASAVGLGNGVLGCVGTGPLIFQCEGAMAAVEGLVTGVNWGAERKSIWDGETACMQGQ